MTMDASRPFYRLGGVRFLTIIPRKDFLLYMETQFNLGNYRSEQDALTFILDAAEDVPFNVQMLANVCWELLQGEPSYAGLTRAVVAEALDILVGRYDPYYTRLWNMATGIQQKTLLAVIQQQGSNLLSGETARLVGKTASTVQKSLESLVAHGILRTEETQNAVRLRFDDPFFARWISMFASI